MQTDPLPAVQWRGRIKPPSYTCHGSVTKTSRPSRCSTHLVEDDGPRERCKRAVSVPIGMLATCSRRFYVAPRQAAPNKHDSVSLAAHLDAGALNVPRTRRAPRTSRSTAGRQTQDSIEERQHQQRPPWWNHFTQAPHVLCETARNGGSPSPPLMPILPYLATAEITYFFPDWVAEPCGPNVD